MKQLSKLLLSVVSGLGVWLGAHLAFTRAWQVLFHAWNLNADTIAYAPAWAATLAQISDALSGTLACALAFVCSYWVGTRIFGRARWSVIDWMKGALVGALAASALIGVFLLFDCVRIAPGGAVFSWVTAAALVERFATCLFLAMFLRANISRALGDGKLRYIAFALAACGQVFMSGALSGGLHTIAILNALCVSLVYCAWLSDTGSILTEVGAAFCFQAIAQILFGFPLGGVLETYPVSENLLTGGMRGLSASPLLTATLIAYLALRARKRRKSAII